MTSLTGTGHGTGVALAKSYDSVAMVGTGRGTGTMTGKLTKLPKLQGAGAGRGDLVIETVNPASTKKVALVVPNTGAPSTGEAYIKTSLEAVGCYVKYLDDGVEQWQLDDMAYDLIVLSDLAAAPSHTFWKDSKKPVLVLADAEPMKLGDVGATTGTHFAIPPDAPKWVSGYPTIGLVVGNSAGLTAGDTYLRTLFSTFNYQVTIYDDGATEASVTDDIVVIADSVTAATVGTKWKDVAKSVLVGEHTLWQEHELSSDDGATSSVAVFTVPLTKPDWVTLETVEYSLLSDGSAVAVASNGVADIETPAVVQYIAKNDADDFGHGWVIEAGALRDDSTAAPGRRAAFALTETVLTGTPSVEYETLVRDLIGWLAMRYDPFLSTAASTNIYQFDSTTADIPENAAVVARRAMDATKYVCYAVDEETSVLVDGLPAMGRRVFLTGRNSTLGGSVSTAYTTLLQDCALWLLRQKRVVTASGTGVGHGKLNLSNSNMDVKVAGTMRAVTPTAVLVGAHSGVEITYPNL